MKDAYSRYQMSNWDIVERLLTMPTVDLTNAVFVSANEYNNSVKTNFSDFELVDMPTEDIALFHSTRQQHWFMPEEYQNLDIAAYVIGKCQRSEELTRAAEELILYQDLNLFPLLKYLKYLVDTIQQNNIVCGVGRGSSVASYVLYLLGVHRIDSIKYELDIREFLRE